MADETPGRSRRSLPASAEGHSSPRRQVRSLIAWYLGLGGAWLGVSLASGAPPSGLCRTAWITVAFIPQVLVQWIVTRRLWAAGLVQSALGALAAGVVGALLMYVGTAAGFVLGVMMLLPLIEPGAAGALAAYAAYARLLSPTASRLWRAAG